MLQLKVCVSCGLESASKKKNLFLFFRVGLLFESFREFVWDRIQSMDWASSTGAITSKNYAGKESIFFLNKNEPIKKW